MENILKKTKNMKKEETIYTLKLAETMDRRDWILGLNASGYAGIKKGDGMIVDRREFKDAIPVQRNNMFGVVDPKKIKE